MVSPTPAAGAATILVPMGGKVNTYRIYLSPPNKVLPYPLENLVKGKTLGGDYCTGIE